MNDITNMSSFSDDNGGGGGGHNPQGYSFIKTESELHYKNVTLIKIPAKVRLKDGKMYDTYVIKPEKECTQSIQDKVRKAALRVLHSPNSSKAAKTARGSALSQRSKR